MMESCRRLRCVDVRALRMSSPRSAAHLTKNVFSYLFRVWVCCQSAVSDQWTFVMTIRLTRASSSCQYCDYPSYLCTYIDECLVRDIIAKCGFSCNAALPKVYICCRHNKVSVGHVSCLFVIVSPYRTHAIAAAELLSSFFCTSPLQEELSHTSPKA